jgi:hypothetical protein
MKNGSPGVSPHLSRRSRLPAKVKKSANGYPFALELISPGLPGFRRSHFLVALFHRGPLREPHAAFFVHAKVFDRNVIADLDDVLGFLDAEIGQFADVNQAILAGQAF